MFSDQNFSIMTDSDRYFLCLQYILMIKIIDFPVEISEYSPSILSVVLLIPNILSRKDL